MYISNGGVGSTHCRTMALWSACHDRRCHVVLHGTADEREAFSLALLSRFGAGYEVVAPSAIAEAIAAAGNRFREQGLDVVVIPGGGHARDGVLAFSAHAARVLAAARPDHVVHASGTGGTQAGIVHAVHEIGLTRTRVHGISVARAAERGSDLVQESLAEIGASDLPVDFRDRYRGPDYGRGAESTREAVALAARHGILLDATYTGKAFDGLLDLVRSGEILPGARVLFWHTGATFNGALDAAGSAAG